MTQSLVTIAIPFADRNRSRVQEHLDGMGNPATGAIAAALDQSELVHFMSINVVPAENTSYLLIELNADGTTEAVIEKLAAAIGDAVQQLLMAAGVAPGRVPLAKFLRDRELRVSQGWLGTTGLNFSGTPGMTVPRIKREAELARRVASMLDDMPRLPSARDMLERVRAELWDELSMKWAFVAEPAPMLDGAPSFWTQGIWTMVWPAVTEILWPFLLVPVIAFATGWSLAGARTGGWLALLAVVAEVGFGLLAYRRLRRKEDTDLSEDMEPAAAAVAEMMTREAYAAQNHMFAVSTMKPGPLRRFCLRLGLWVAGQLSVAASRPGFLTDLGVIHFARWLVPPGTDRLVFFSNFDGAWESYLENFIEQSDKGVNIIWSNARGFPKTQKLVFGGARDGDRLKRWVRRQQLPSRFWYSAYPTLTLPRIRTNAAIRQGIALAATDAEAEDWLSCFGSLPRPAAAVEIGEVPSLALRRLRHLRFGACVLLRFADAQASAKRWLERLEPRLSYGDDRAAVSATLLALSATGLRKLGLGEGDLATFPVAFQQGNDAPWRARALGDIGKNAPEQWYWGKKSAPVDAVALIYAESAEALQGLGGQLTQEARHFGHEIVQQVRLRPPPADRAEISREPFGYADGVSQPVIRGTPRAAAADPQQVVEPGEFVLGYVNNLGYLPPSPTVPAEADPRGILPTLAEAEGQRPNFSRPLAAARHDLGRNGTFLVVRQLEQNVEAFKDYLAEAATGLADDPRVPARLTQEERVDWLGAKLVGRWKNGSPLVRHPDRPGPQPRDSDKDLLLGVEDAAGLRCPLGAHIRRANPRDSFNPGSEDELSITSRHRILRVGRSYEPQNGWEKPGLMFMCLNGDIERQFEFVQQTWVQGASFLGLEDESDGLIGNRAKSGTFTIPTPHGPLRLKGLPDFVTVRGGGYFFLPSRRALRFLAQ